MDIHELIEQLASDHAVIRLRALQNLVQQGSAAVPILLHRLAEHGSSRQKAGIIAVLEEIQDKRAVEVLIEALTHPSITIRMAAAKALGNFPEPGVYAALIERMYQETGIVQSWVVMSLGKLGDHHAVAPLLDLLHETTSATTKHTIIRVLGEIGDPAVIPYIEAFADDPDAHVQRSVRLALEQFNQGNE